MIHREKIAVTTTGSAGSATGTATTDKVISGRVVRVDVDYHASAAATTDLTLAEVGDQIATNIVNLANTNTDTQVFPTVALTDNTATGRTYDGTRPVVDYYPVNDKLIATIAQGDALAPCVTLVIYYEE